MIEPKRACSHPACPELVDGRWCKAHERTRGPKRELRASAAARGYDRDWQEWREWFIRRHPLCEDCLAEGVSEPTHQVHHRIPLRERPDLRFEEENCQPLCDSHHSRRTAAGG